MEIYYIGCIENKKRCNVKYRAYIGPFVYVNSKDYTEDIVC